MKYLEIFAYFGLIVLLAWESSQVDILENKLDKVLRDYIALTTQTDHLIDSFIHIIENRESISDGDYHRLKKIFEGGVLK